MELMHIGGRLAVLAYYKRAHSAIRAQHRLHCVRRAHIMGSDISSCVEALSMALILAVHRMRTLCNCPTLPVVTCTRREVRLTAAVDRLHIEEVIRGVPLPLSAALGATAHTLIGSAVGSVCDAHAAVEAAIRHNAELTSATCT